MGSGIKLKTRTKCRSLAVYLAICSLQTQHACNSLGKTSQNPKKLFVICFKGKTKKSSWKTKHFSPSPKQIFSSLGINLIQAKNLQRTRKSSLPMVSLSPLFCKWLPKNPLRAGAPVFSKPDTHKKSEISAHLQATLFAQVVEAENEVDGWEWLRRRENYRRVQKVLIF